MKKHLIALLLAALFALRRIDGLKGGESAVQAEQAPPPPAEDAGDASAINESVGINSSPAT
ncbi:MAG: hypothetical protein IKH84_04795 [Ottowia sp.]|nr:hypothetical protein [Ottowia sp.]